MSEGSSEKKPTPDRDPQMERVELIARISRQLDILEDKLRGDRPTATGRDEFIRIEFDRQTGEIKHGHRLPGTVNQGSGVPDQNYDMNLCIGFLVYNTNNLKDPKSFFRITGFKLPEPSDFTDEGRVGEPTETAIENIRQAIEMNRRVREGDFKL